MGLHTLLNMLYDSFISKATNIADLTFWSFFTTVVVCMAQICYQRRVDGHLTLPPKKSKESTNDTDAEKESFIMLIDKLNQMQSILSEQLEKNENHNTLLQQMVEGNLRTTNTLMEIQATLNNSQMCRTFVPSSAQAPLPPPLPPPPPPPPPPMSMITPISRVDTSKKEQKKKKIKTDGPPQLNLTQEVIANKLHSLRKTSNGLKLLAASKHGRKSPARRTLFVKKSPFAQNRRSLTRNNN